MTGATLVDPPEGTRWALVQGVLVPRAYLQLVGSDWVDQGHGWFYLDAAGMAQRPLLSAFLVRPSSARRVSRRLARRWRRSSGSGAARRNRAAEAERVAEERRVREEQQWRAVADAARGHR